MGYLNSIRSFNPTSMILSGLIALVSSSAYAATITGEGLLGPVAAGDVLEGRGFSAYSGDNLTLIADAPFSEIHAGRRIRLHGIDAPERAQPIGMEARHMLKYWTMGKVRVEVVRINEHKQPVGIVWAEGSGKRAGTWVNLSHELVRRGLAWLDPDVADPELAALEAEAREQKIGLWALPEAERVPPWEWRVAKAEEKRLRRLERQANKASKEVRK